ncbi:MAG: mandelate racemase/muconate lactonizing enzyme family protein [Candidatus Bathyarchaeota archaeon]|jgi:L-alanine-DL-glutamate epimerase-like enolase superfamily enzyme|nr:mandelate racemase/muconate lactonizing enzyme family protein [Candidatus Bathyarchaeota archaeon]
MEITDVRTTMVTVPFAVFGKFEPVTMWYGTRYASIHCVTFIDTDEGITGVATEGDQHTIMNRIRPRLIGKDPFEIEKIEHELGGKIRGRWEIDTKTMAAVDNALWDVIGKACDKPLYKLWGGRVNDPIHVRYWLSCKSPEGQAAEALKAVERGWKSLKIKLGTDPTTDLERVKAVREAVGYNIELCFDINGGYPLHVAINTLRKMARYEPASVEDPVPNFWPYDAGSLDNMADIRRMTGIPIEAHSHGPNCEEFVMALLDKRAADAVHLGIQFAGGILEARRVCAVAEAGGLIVTGQSSAAELGPRNALTLHFIASERSFKGTNDSSTHLLEPPSGDIIKDEFRTVDGTLKVPEGPGLGVEIDKGKLAHYHEIYLSGKYQHTSGLGRKDPYLWF